MCEARREHYACFGDELDSSGSDNSYPEVDCKMHAATGTAEKDAVASWFWHYSKHGSEMPTVPTSLMHFVPVDGRKQKF